MASAKEGIGIDEILEAIVKRIPPPQGDPNAPLRALTFDSHYNQYKGVIAYVRVMDGELRTGQPVLFMGTGAQTDTLEIGVFRPGMTPINVLHTGETGIYRDGPEGCGR